jgi:hypothetical protein
MILTIAQILIDRNFNSWGQGLICDLRVFIRRWKFWSSVIFFLMTVTRRLTDEWVKPNKFPSGNP